MFTGIIKAKGTVSSIEDRGGDQRLTIESIDIPWREFDIGESISINGVCLTAILLRDNGFVADVSVETLNITALANIAVGDPINIEPSLSLGERLGGHLVSGHVDCVGMVEALDGDARSIRLRIAIPDAYQRFVASKGSICVDGVSLTVNTVKDGSFEVNIIPHTADVTIICSYKKGTRVNIEVDLVARYLERLIRKDNSGITKDFLKAHGYA
ncbi:MAG: riboflavin synthase [Woeseiaceae bacterium]|nr:riboflavin synthase [Woeseiaceae bacterium]